MEKYTDSSRRRRWRTPGSSALRVSIAMLALVSLLAACGPGDDGGEQADSTEGSAGGESTEGAGSGDEEADLVVWISRDFYVPGDEFASFEEEHPGVTVQYDVLPDDDILQRLERAREAGQPLPDIIHDDGFLQPVYANLDFLQPLDDCLARWEEENPENFEAIPEQQWIDGTVDGEVVGMPYGTPANFLYYNIPWAEEGGVAPPFETWDDVLSGLQDMKQARPDDYPYALQALEGEGVNAQLMMMGGMAVEFENAVPQLDTEAGHYLLDFYKTMADEGITSPEAVAHGENETRGNFLGGRAGALIDAVSAFDDFEEPADFNYGEQFGVATLPTQRTPDSEEGVNFGTSRHYMMVAGTEHPEAACDLLMWFMETEQILDIVEVGGSPTRQRDAIYSEQLLDTLPFFEDDDVKEAYMALEPVPNSDQFGDVVEILERLFAEIAVGTDKSAEELAAEYQPQLDEAGAES